MIGQGFGVGGYGMMGGGSFMMLLFLAVIGFLFYLAINKQTPNQKDAQLVSKQSADSDALMIAKTRLANGEISVEEFDQIKRNLF